MRGGKPAGRWNAAAWRGAERRHAQSQARRSLRLAGEMRSREAGQGSERPFSAPGVYLGEARAPILIGAGKPSLGTTRVLLRDEIRPQRCQSPRRAATTCCLLKFRFRRTLFVDATPRRPYHWDVSAAPLQWDGMAHGIHGLGGDGSPGPRACQGIRIPRVVPRMRVTRPPAVPGGCGERTVRLHGLGGGAPGAYLLRLTQVRTRRLARAAIMRCLLRASAHLYCRTSFRSAFSPPDSRGRPARGDRQRRGLHPAACATSRLRALRRGSVAGATSTGGPGSSSAASA